MEIIPWFIEDGLLLLAILLGASAAICDYIKPGRKFLQVVLIAAALFFSFEAGRVHGVFAMRDAVIDAVHKKIQQEEVK